MRSGHSWAAHWRTVVFGLLVGATVVGLWWWTAYIMLRHEVRWRALLPTGLLTAAGSAAYGVAAAIWVPWSVIHNDEQFGAFGVAMTLVSWLVGMSMVVVAAVVLETELALQPGRLGDWLRGGAASPLRPDAPAALPPTPW